MGFANVTLHGNLGRDAELRTTKGGDQLLAFNLAVSDRRGGAETTSWFACSVWGKRAQSLAPHLTKGTKVVVTGSLQTREFETKGGEKRTSLDVRVDQFDFAGGGQQASRAEGVSSSLGLAPSSNPTNATGFDEDIPF